MTDGGCSCFQALQDLFPRDMSLGRCSGGLTLIERDAGRLMMGLAAAACRKCCVCIRACKCRGAASSLSIDLPGNWR